MFERTPGYGHQYQGVVPWSVSPLNTLTLTHRRSLGGCGCIGECGCGEGCGCAGGLGFTASGAEGGWFDFTPGNLLLLAGLGAVALWLAAGPGARVRRRKLGAERERHARAMRELKRRYDRLGLKETGRRLKRLGAEV